MFEEKYNQVRDYLQAFFELPSEALGRSCGFVKRSSKLTTSLFVETLVLGLLEKGDATLTDLVEVAEKLGVEVTESGLAQRLNAGAEQVLKQLVQLGMEHFAEATTHSSGVLRSFSAVNLCDSTQVALPNRCQELFRGSGGCASEASAKIQLNYEYLSGTFTGLEVCSGREPDQHCPFPVQLATANSLMLFDLGYFTLTVLAAIAAVGAWFITRLHSQTPVYWNETDGQPADLLGYLEKQAAAVGELSVCLGANARLPVRIIFSRLPDDVVAEKRRRARHNAKKKKRSCSAIHLRFLAWQLCITNVPSFRLSAQHVLLVYHLRWQIELVFKLWKSWAKLTTIRFSSPRHVTCLLYAHLLGLLLFQWLIAPHRFSPSTELSPTKAFNHFQKFVPSLIRRITRGWRSVASCLARFFAELQRFATKTTRHKSPSTYQAFTRQCL